VGLLGILKAGGAYVPLDPLFPPDRLTFILEDTAASVVVTTEHLVPKLPTSDLTAVVVDSAWQTISKCPGNNFDSGVTRENLVYVLFTSGSTGKPKGVAVEHRQLTNYVNGILERLNLPTGSSFATVSTLAADLGNTAIFPSLCSGGILHVLSQERAWDSASLIDYFERHPVDCLKIVPSHLQALLSCSRPAQVLPRKRLVLGGEPLSFDLAERIQELAPDTVVFNHSGPTETTVGVITYRLSKAEPRRSTTVPIGRPLPNTQIYLLDKNLQPVPVGVPGEIYVAGSGLARGYLKRPDLTTEKFVLSVLGNHAGVRLYKTGDRARYLPDGNLEFLGRVDNQVKIRGFRIELGEIEAALRQHPGVNDGTVIARDDVPGDRRLIAYVVPNHLQSFAVSDLRKFFKKRLPDYMQPSAYVMLETLPLTPNGKVNRQALPAPDQSRPDDLKEAFVPASHPAEKMIAEIWAEALHLDRIGIYDNFFDLGGHSLLLMQVHSRISSLFHKNLPLIKMFEHSTVYSLARYLSESSNEDALSREDQKQTQRLENRKTRLQQIRDRIKREQLNEQL
jgi:amino acid adenylation domain-containing protein